MAGGAKRDGGKAGDTARSSALDGLARVHARIGWTLLCAALLFGLSLEGLLGFKSEGLLEDSIRRELWSLAHFHGIGLALVNLVYAAWAESDTLSVAWRRAASRALAVGSMMLPAGFLLGGLSHPEGDPGIGILLVPAGAALVVFAAAAHAVAAWRS